MDVPAPGRLRGRLRAGEAQAARSRPPRARSPRAPAPRSAALASGRADRRAGRGRRGDNGGAGPDRGPAPRARPLCGPAPRVRHWPPRLTSWGLRTRRGRPPQGDAPGCGAAGGAAAPHKGAEPPAEPRSRSGVTAGPRAPRPPQGRGAGSGSARVTARPETLRHGAHAAPAHPLSLPQHSPPHRARPCPPTRGG